MKNSSLHPVAGSLAGQNLSEIHLGRSRACIVTSTRLAKDACAPESALHPGYYYCYFPLHGNSHFLMRSLIIVKRGPHGMIFSRFTLFPSEQAGKRKLLARAKHSGLILANSHEIYFIGLNANAPHQISFISVERSNSGSAHLLTGLAITRTATSPMSSRVCLQYLGPTGKLHPLLRELGPIDIESASVNAFVRTALWPRLEPYGNEVAHLGLDQTLVQSLRKRS